MTWAIDNVYIGPQCEDMCNGHGSCVNGTKCICDPGYSGPTCRISTKNPDFLKDDFEGISACLPACQFLCLDLDVICSAIKEGQEALRGFLHVMEVKYSLRIIKLSMLFKI